jgi:hypothetical protein
MPFLGAGAEVILILFSGWSQRFPPTQVRFASFFGFFLGYILYLFCTSDFNSVFVFI